MRVWTRKGGCQDRQDSEANKWFEVVDCVETASQPLAQRITFIHDREGDIFALWQRVIPEHDLLTRAKQDRRIAVTETCVTGKLFADLAAQPIGGVFELVIPADAKRQQRESLMEVRWCPVELLEPKKTRKGAQRVKLSAIEVRECAACVPDGEIPLVWVLLTTHPVNALTEAVQKVRWYLYRWRVEDIFAALKTRGVDLEDSTLEDGEAVMKLGVMSLWSANRLTALVKGRDDEITNASEFFPEEELVCMEQFGSTLQGKTTTQKNPYRLRSVAWSVWILARLGRWHGNGRPGLVTIRRGIERFEMVFVGWSLNRRL